MVYGDVPSLERHTSHCEALDPDVQWDALARQRGKDVSEEQALSLKPPKDSRR